MFTRNNYIYVNGKYYKITQPEAIKKQEKWRRQQIKILYDTGRPIFGKYVEKFR